MAASWTRSLFRLTVGGVDISTRVAPILLALQCVDKAGLKSDSATITLDDTGGRVKLPEKGAPVLIHLGNTAQGVVERFRGFVDTARSQGDRGGGRRVEVTAKGMDTTSGVKEPRSKHKDDASLVDAASDFARAAGLEGAAVHPSLASKRRPYWVMDGESYVAWAHRTAAEMGATFKVIGRRGVFVPRSSGQAASGAALAMITAAEGDNLLSWDLTPLSGRPDFQTVRGRWYDVAAARWRTTDVQVEGGSSRRQMAKRAGADEDEGAGNADGEAKRAERDKGGGRVEIIGTPEAVAEATCMVVGTRPGIDGAYTVDSVTDSLDRSRGWVQSLDLVKPGGKAGKDDR